jgi:hypothetical protein
VSDHEGVRRTLAEFGHRADSGDFDGWLDLFAPDGAMHFNGQAYRGRETLAAFIREDQTPDRRGVHFTTDSIIDIDGDTAVVASKFLFIGPGGQVPVLFAAGLYDDVLVRSGARWLIKERKATVITRG